MRDNDTMPDLPRTVVEQPDPMLEEKPASRFRIVAILAAAVALVVLVLYGMSRPSEPMQTATGPETAAPASATPQPPATNGQRQQGQPKQGQAKPDQANSAPQPAGAKPATKPPSTTGQGQPGQPQPKAQRSDSAIDGRPSDKPAHQQK
jgi:hypothetical protein